MTPDALLLLPAGTVRSVPSGGVTCIEGLCWATQAGDARDHVLRPGGSWQPAPRRAALVWALTDTTVRLAVRKPRQGPLEFLIRSLLQVLGPVRA